MFQFSNHGSRERVIYGSVVGKDGAIVVEPVGKEDLQDYIESFADACDVEKIVARAVNGEPELLQRNTPQYGDFTKMPKTYAQLLQRLIDAETLFNGLDQSVKDAFGNDFHKFFANLDNKDMLEKAGLIKTEVKAAEEIIVEKDVKE